MRVLHLLNQLDTGGAECLVLNLARKVDRARFTLLVGSLAGEGDLSPEFHRLGVPTYPLHRRPGLDVSLVPRLVRLMRRERVDVLHTHNVTPWLYGGLAARLARVRLCHTEHSNLFPEQKRLALAERGLAYLTKVVISDSERVRQHLVERQKLPPDKVVTVVNGIDVEAFGRAVDKAAGRRALGLPPAGLVVGTVGRLVPVKDHLTLLAAFETIAAGRQDVHLVVVGDGPERASLEARVREARLEGRVWLLGRRRDVADLMGLFDVFVLSSVSEGLPLTIIEAMAAGLPVVATDVGGNSQAVRDQVTGYLVPPSDPAALARAIARLLDDPPLRERLAHEARHSARTTFDLAVMARRYEEAWS
jgi:sugar transferase (PEP-CTERM/EpsH1 system associated)